MPTLMGKYKVPRVDGKGRGGRGVQAARLFGMGPKKGPDGRLAITLPMGDKKLPGIAGQDIGKCRLGIFKREQLERRSALPASI
jgi:hypothetical protein